MELYLSFITDILRILNGNWTRIAYIFYTVRVLIKIKNKPTYYPILSRVLMQMWFILRPIRFCIRW